jgi:site-specific recombinase XerD
VPRSMRAEQHPTPYDHHLQEFLTSLKRERGFADAAIVNRERSLKPFLSWLVAQDVPLSTVSPVTITKYFTSVVAGRWKRTTISFHVYSLRSFFRYAPVEVGARPALLSPSTHPASTRTKICRKGRRGKR